MKLTQQRIPKMPTFRLRIQYLQPNMGCPPSDFWSISMDLRPSTIVVVCRSQLRVRIGLQAMARENIEIMRGKLRILVADDSSCASHFKDYPNYF